MKSQRSFGQPKKLSVLGLRQTSGWSMSPTIRPGQLIVATGLFKDVHVGDIIIFVHHGKEKIKRIKHVDPLKGVFVVGDNAHYSTDSRSFGWIDFTEVVGKVIWPLGKG